MKLHNLLRTLSAICLIGLTVALAPASPAAAAPAITLGTNHGSIGDTVTILGTGFNPTTDSIVRGVSIYFSKTNPASINLANDIYETVKIYDIDTEGEFSTTFTVPANLTGGTTDQAVTDGTYYILINYYLPSFNPPTADTVVRASATFTVATPKITIDPDNGKVGTQIDINGTGFGVSKNISVEFDGEDIDITGDDDTNSNGAFGDTYIVVPPSTAGDHTIKVLDSAAISKVATFTVNPDFQTTPASGLAGTSIEATGTGFAGNAEVSIQFNGVEIATVNSNAKGSFSTSFTPATSTAGTYTIVADDGSNSLQSTFKVTAILMDINPTEGEKGTLVTINGTGFLSNTPIFITFGGINIPSTARTNSNGAFATQFSVPIETVGTYDVVATDGTNSKTLPFTINEVIIPTVHSINPQTSTSAPGHVGSQLTISGDGYTPGARIVITWDGTEIATAIAKTDGSFSYIVTAPVSIGGEHIIKAKEDDDHFHDYTFYMESTAPAIPQLLTPEANIKAKDEAFFDWSDVTDPSGLSYTLQIATDINFAQSLIVLEKKGLDMSEYQVTPAEALNSVSKDAPYYWRVRAIDSLGNDSDWTQPRSFYVGSAFGISQGVIYALIAVGALVLAVFAFWMGRKTAYY